MALRRPAVLIHGAWVNGQSWEHLQLRLEARGMTCLAPDGPFKDRPVAELRAAPDPALARLGLDDVVEHFARIVRACPEPPLLIGHSLGGLIVQMLLDRDLGHAGVALCPAPPRGVLPLHASLVQAMMPLLARPYGWHGLKRLSLKAWRRDYAASMPFADQTAAFERYIAPESGRLWCQLTASLVTGAGGVSFRDRDRRPLLLVAANEDRIVPPATVLANQRAYLAPTALRRLEGRGHWVLAEQDAEALADLICAFAAPHWAPSQPRTRSVQPARSDRAAGRRWPVVIVGGGPAGLATGAALRSRDVESLILESADEVGQSWRNGYDRLRLHTVRALSGLPGFAIPRAWGDWIAAHDYATYLARYARHHDLQLATATTVSRVVRTGDIGWRIESPSGIYHAAQVVIATGLNRQPHLPDWAATAASGLVSHSSRYRGHAPLRGLDVLVVGAGNSGAEIATDLAAGGAGRVRLSVRSGPTVLPRSILGIPTQAIGLLVGGLPRTLTDPAAAMLQRVICGDLGRVGLTRPNSGLFTRLERDLAAPVIDVGLLSALRTRRVEAVGAVVAIEGREVVLADGTRLTPDGVIAATGFHPDLRPLLGDEVHLDAFGLPAGAGDAAPVAPGLYCAGYLVSAGGVLNAIARQAERIAASISTSTVARTSAT